MREVNAIQGKKLFLGRCGENMASRVVFDISEWLSVYGDGTVQLIHQRNGDKTPYPCVIEQNANIVTWDITNSDVAVAGRGRAELQYYVGDTLVKSETYATNTERALGPASETPPDPYQGWVDQVLEAANDAEASKQHAEASAHNAKNSAEAAERHAETAKENVEAALKEAMQSGEFDGVGVDDIKQTFKSEEDDGNNEISVELSNGSVKKFYVQNGSRGPKGDSGIATPVSGFFTLYVDANGDLWACCEEDEKLNFEYDSETGALYIVQEVKEEV